MIITGGHDALAALLRRQVDSLFGLEDMDKELIDMHLFEACDHARHCFERVENRHYQRDNDVQFNPLNGGQFCIFLYMLARIMFEHTGNSRTTDKLYMLNRTISGADLYYEVELPRVWFLDHSSGIVLGRACYSNYLCVSQGCTVGNNHGRYPVIGNDVTLYAGAQVIGDCKIGNRVVLAAGASVLDADVPDDSIVFGRSPDITIKPLPADKRPRHFISPAQEAR